MRGKDMRRLFIVGIIVSMMMACGASYADYGWGQSGAFSVNLLTNRGTLHYAYKDSSSFSVDLLNVQRASADSADFQYNWLENTTCQIGPYRLPVQSSEDKLLVLDSCGNWVIPTAPPPNGAIVIILNHGWNDGPSGWLDIAQSMQNRVLDAYIYTWHWGDGPDAVSRANPNGKPAGGDFAEVLSCNLLPISRCVIDATPLLKEVQKTLTNAAEDGGWLGDKLLSFGIRPDSPSSHKIHMIGHSFGGVVSAVAAKKLATTGTEIEQLTAIETPALIYPYAVDNIDPSSAKRVEVLYYDWTNYLLEGATGGPLFTTSSNVLNLSLNDFYYPVPWMLHSKAFDWYNGTVAEDVVNCSGDPYGFGWSVSLFNPQWPDDLPLGSKFENKLGKGCVDYSDGIKNIATKVANAIVDEFTTATTWTGKNAALVLDAGVNSVVKLSAAGTVSSQGFVSALAESSEPNVAYIYKDVNVPPDAEQLFFDYRFVSYNPGDTLSLSIDSNTPLVIDAEVAGITSIYQTSSPVFVGDYAGMTITLQISLRSTGETPAQVYIDNLRFTAVTIVEDVNGDKAINELDLLILAQNWLTVGCDFRDHCDGADINQDNNVDLTDFATMASLWYKSF